MPTFAYKAKTKDADTAQGLLDAETRVLALEKLSAKGFFPLKVEEIQAGDGASSARPGAKDVVFFTRQLADLLGANVPLLKALGLLERQSRRKNLKALVTGLLNDVHGGSSFSGALGRRADVFPPIFIGLAKAGELSGTLSAALAQLAEFTEREDEVRARLRAAMIYPLFIGSLGAGTVLFLFFFIVPKLSVLFVDMSSNLPWITRAILRAGDFLRRAVWVWPLLIAGLVMGARSFRSHEKARMSMDRRLLAIPIWGNLLRKAAVARFAKTLGLLLKNGVPLLEALRTVADVLGHPSLKRQALSAARRVEDGEGLGDALSTEPDFPEFLCNMIRVGEEGNVLEGALIKVASSYERDTERSLKVLSSLLEPVMILAVGSVIGLIVMGLLLPIFNMPALIK